MHNLPFWKFVLRKLSEDRPVFAAFVAHNTRHSPGTTGAALAAAYTASDTFASIENFGTIGGGIMEAEVLAQAEKALQDQGFSPRFERLFHRRKAPQSEAARPSGLICAGNQTNVYVRFSCDDLKLVEEIVRRLECDVPGRLHIGPEGLSLDDYSPPRIEAPLVFEQSDGDEQGFWHFSAQLLNWKRIAIIGGGHCGLALSQVMSQLGFVVSVFDNRPDVFTFRDNEHATYLVAVDDLVEAGEQITHRTWTHVAVMTANLPSDVRGLLGIAEGPYPYIGVMGAPAKLARIRSELLAGGVSEEAIARIRAPIGLPMTSNTPEEIAVSVAAEILALRETLFPFTQPASI